MADLRSNLLSIQRLTQELDSSCFSGELHAGASNADLLQLEQSIEQVPTDLRELLRVMNGEPSNSHLCLTCKFLSTTEIVAARHELTGIAPDSGPVSEADQIANPYIDGKSGILPQWIPIASFGSYGYVIIDPNPKNSNHQVIFYWEYSGPSCSHVFATTVYELLDSIEQLLKACKHTWIPSIRELPPVRVF